MYPAVHKIKNKDKETSKSKKEMKKKILKSYWTRTHICWVLKQLNYPLGYWEIVINFIQISNCKTI